MNSKPPSKMSSKRGHDEMIAPSEIPHPEQRTLSPMPSSPGGIAQRQSAHPLGTSANEHERPSPSKKARHGNIPGGRPPPPLSPMPSSPPSGRSTPLSPMRPPPTTGQLVEVRSQNTQGYSGLSITAERRRLALASARGQAAVSCFQEAGEAPPLWPWEPVPGQPSLRQAVLPASGRGGAVYAVHQTPPPGPSGVVPTRNGQLIMSTEPFIPESLTQASSSAVPSTQRAALVARTVHGTFASQHAVSGVPALSTVQTQDVWNQLVAMTTPGELIILAGDFNHGRAASVAAAAAIVPAPHVFRAIGATHQGGSSLDGFWTNSPAVGPATTTTGMTGDHWGVSIMLPTHQRRHAGENSPDSAATRKGS